MTKNLNSWKKISDAGRDSNEELNRYRDLLNASNIPKSCFAREFKKIKDLMQRITYNLENKAAKNICFKNGDMDDDCYATVEKMFRY